MGRVAADAYLMWPRHVAMPGLHQEHTPSHQCPPTVNKPDRPTSIQGNVVQTKNASHIAFTVSSHVADVVTVVSVPHELGVPACSTVCTAKS